MVRFVGGLFVSHKTYFNNMYDNILIDGKNIAYRAAAASRSNEYNTHPSTIFIRMLDKWRRIYNPANWHVFWDVPKETLWRKDIFPEYKEGRPNYDEIYSECLKSAQTVTIQVLNYMGITQYIKKREEADDLIYAFALEFEDSKNIIISSDGDITQIPYHLKHLKVDLHNPHKKDQALVPVPKYDPVIVKSLSGDSADNIPNYRLVADKTACKIINKGLDEFLDKKGRDLFERNKKLIDLSLNPNLDDNREFVRNMKINDKFDLKKIKVLIDKHNIKGMRSEMISKIKPFKNIIGD